MTPTETPTYLLVQDHLAKALTDWRQRGVHYYEEFDWSAKTDEGWTERRREYSKQRPTGIVSPGAISSYLRGIAKDLKRPFIKASRHPYQPARDRIYLRMPRQKQLAELCAVFFLVAKTEGIDTADVYWAQGATTTLQFWFNTEFGREMFFDWLTKCETDPDFKKVLGTD